MSKLDLIKQFSSEATNTGKTEVQIAILHHDVKNITAHLQNNKKDFSSTLGLTNKVQHMYKLLQYLHKKDSERYYQIINTLNIKDVVKIKLNKKRTY